MRAKGGMGGRPPPRDTADDEYFCLDKADPVDRMDGTRDLAATRATAATFMLLVRCGDR
jgi:hypothetical protein